jgi:hypothetical protein
MSLRKFGSDDIILNTMKAHPSCEFFIFDSKVYYNKIPEHSGALSNNVLNVPPGHISLYEYNIDRATGTNDFIYPWVIKGSSRETFTTVATKDFDTLYAVGETVVGSYPMSASITREFMGEYDPTMADFLGAGSTETYLWGTDADGYAVYSERPRWRHFYALKNRLNYYGMRSLHYKVSSSYGDKSLQAINLISIPSIFYGSQIKPGTLSLKWYYTGSLVGELQDTKQNGELIEVSGSNIGSVAGVALYDEGFILLTGSWALQDGAITPLRMLSGSTTTRPPSWLFFGIGANDDVNQGTLGTTAYKNTSFDLSFKGTTETQVMTMFAHARRGKVNYSNNPTFLDYGQEQIHLTSSQIYEESSTRTIKNTVTSSYTDYSASFKRQVYVSRVAIYDDHKNLIGVATLSNPILKEEDQDYSFKIRLDI